MGHACSILTFDSKLSKEKIEKACDTWGDRNCDLEERNWIMGIGLGFPVRFTSRIFDDYESAREYLDSTFGHYSQIAVQYREYPKISPSKKLNELNERLVKAKARLCDLEKPHYKGVSISTVKCKRCGSSLATSYCGMSWYNNCPICNADLRPESKLERIAKCKDSIKDIEKSIREENMKAQTKMKSKSKLKWAVACEVHC